MDFNQNESRVERLNTMIRENRVVRDAWGTRDEQGREMACLLVALSPEAGEAKNPAACPAAVMPQWFARLTPWIDDFGSEAAWPQMIRRYAACAAKWDAIDEAAWRRVEIAARRAAVREAMHHTTDEQVRNSCRDVLAWLDADMPEASRAAVQAAAQAAWVAAGAAWVQAAVVDADEPTNGRAAQTARAAEVAWTAADAAAECGDIEHADTAQAVASLAALSAVLSETETDPDADVAESATFELDAMMAAAGDRITDEILSALEQECVLAVR